MNCIATHSGIVKKNLQRGRQLGYPTANIPYDGDLEDGVYLAFVDDGSENQHNALAFIGAPETFDDPTRKMEVYILDFNQDLYGKKIDVCLLKKTRGNIKFSNVEDLIKQMKQDEEDARHYFDTMKK